MKNKVPHIESWLISKNPKYAKIDHDLNIFETRFIDSLDFMELVNLIEDLIGEELDMDKLSLNDFSSINNMKYRFNFQ